MLISACLAEAGAEGPLLQVQALQALAVLAVAAVMPRAGKVDQVGWAVAAEVEWAVAAQVEWAVAAVVEWAKARVQAAV